MLRPLATLGIALLYALLVAANAPSIAFAAEDPQYSEPELRTYAFANAGVRLIQGQLDRQLLGAQGGAEETRELEAAAQEQMSAAIERAGLSEEGYEAMTQEIAADEELKATVRAYLDEEMGIVR